MRSFLLFILMIGSLFASAQTKEEIMIEGDSLYEKGEYEAALTIYVNGLSKYQDDKALLFQKAACLDMLGEVTDAYEAYSYLIKKHPKYSIAYNNRGLLLLEVQEFELAAKDFTSALEYATNDSIRLSALLNRGSVKRNTRDFQGSYEDLMEALKIDSLNIGVINNLAIIGHELGKPEITFQNLFKILSIKPDEPIVYTNIGFAFQERGQCDTALFYFNKAIALDSNGAFAYSNRGYCLYKLGKLEPALKDVDHSLKLYSSNAYAYRTRALINIAMGKTAEACKDIDMALFFKFTITYGNEVEELKNKYCK